MSEEEEIIVPLPPKKVLGLTLAVDAQHWARKWSTWLAMAALAFDGAGLTFMAAPGEWRAAFPASAGVALLIIGMAAKALIPVATSIQQQGLRK